MTKVIFEKSIEGLSGVEITDEDIKIENYIGAKNLRNDAPELPQVSELEAMRHFTELSNRNFCIEKGFYPLGSCTMKYNPKINDFTSALDGFLNIHPEQPEDTVQGALELMYKLQNALKEVTGMNAVSLQPAAGAHGELTGMMIIKKYFESKGEKRTKVIIPDSAHGTNPASAKTCGFDVVEIKSNDKGQVDLDELKTLLSNDVAAIMMTNPNTLGLFEENIVEISKMVHEVGALLYYDGANLNAVMGITNPALMGFDVCHINLHKTFSTPHGGGGPGVGPVGVVEKLKDFLPVPVVEFDGKKYYKNYNLTNSIGKVKNYYGNFDVFVRAYTYILMMGKYLKNASQDAVLNANYLKEKLKKSYKLPHEMTCMHEFVLSGDLQKENGVSTLNIAKRMMDYGVHPPTVYFPLIVHEAIMIEPTESETKKKLDEFVEIMEKIAQEAKDMPEVVTDAPHSSPVLKIDETLAARKPNLRWKSE